MDKLILDSNGVDETLSRISSEITSNYNRLDHLIFVGIRTKGTQIAHRIGEKIRQTKQVEIPIGTIDTTLYRDDVSVAPRQPILCKTEIPVEITGHTIILIDDVLYTGRTIRAALDAVMDLGRPAAILLAVLVDRGHRELPIRADFIGQRVETGKNQSVRVRLFDNRQEDNVMLVDEPDRKNW
jgi:pyrimidine operon attenuation protein/uracil phosphoribosyltransferase